MTFVADVCKLEVPHYGRIAQLRQLGDVKRAGETHVEVRLWFPHALDGVLLAAKASGWNARARLLVTGKTVVTIWEWPQETA